MTRQGYDVAHAIDIISAFHNRHPHIELIAERALRSRGQRILLSTVRSPTSDLTNVMLDVSFTAHARCLEMPISLLFEST